MAGDRNSLKAETAPAAVTVTQATHSDIPDICALYKRVWGEWKGKLPEDLLKGWQPEPLEFTSWMEGVTYFAARREKRLVGVLGCSLKDGAVSLVHLGVDPEARRAGVGGGLVGAALDWSRRNGAASVWAEAQSRFDGAVRLLTKHGFRPAGTLHRHYWREDVQLLEIVL